MNINMNNNMNEQQSAFVRLLHASPDAPAVDIYANGNIIARNIGYKQRTQYLSVPTGTYNIRVYRSGQRMNPVISTDLTLTPNSTQTVAAVGRLSEIMPLVIEEETMPQLDRNKSYVRFVHLSPDAPAVDITLPDGTILFENTSFTEAGEYIEVDPGSYSLQVRPTGTEQIVLTLPDVRFEPATVYSVYAVGFVEGEPGLEAILITDSSYFH